MTSVSIVIPCYRYATVLQGCVESVLAQDGVDVRVLIVDDCSPDDTPEVAGRLAAADDRVEYRRHADNVGLIGTANEGIELADGDYFVLLSADDLLVPGALRRATSVMNENPAVGMVYGRTLYAHSGAPLPVPNQRWRSTKVWRGEDWIRMRCRSAYNCISSPEVVVRTTVQKAVGGYDPACYHSSDLNMWLRVAAVSDIAFVATVQAIYRIHADSMLRSDDGPMVDLQQRRLAFDRFFDGSAPLPAASHGLRAMACRALARQALWKASRALDRGEVRGSHAAPVDELLAFALDVCTTTRSLREFRGFQLRRWIGAGRSLWFVPFVATGVAHRVHVRMVQQRLRTRGI